MLRAADQATTRALGRAWGYLRTVAATQAPIAQRIEWSGTAGQLDCPAVAVGYSGIPLVRKLGIKPGHTIALLGAPVGWRIEDLPDGVRPSTRARGTFDVIVAFFAGRAQLERRLSALIGVLRSDGGLWIAWPRKAAGHESDISDSALRQIVLPTGLVDVKVAALDEDWSGLKFVWRKELRPHVR
jgi:hypothetical protein